MITPALENPCPDLVALPRAHEARPCRQQSPNGAAPFPIEIGVVGLNHRTAPLDVRSRASVNAEAAERLLAKLGGEGAVLSTCNRTEIYFVRPATCVAGALAEVAGMALAELAPYLYEKRGACAACHLFRVASGMDSAVLGETEIVAQVKEAWQTAERIGATGSTLDLLFQRALETSKRIRTETELCRSVTSTGSLAVREAEARLGDLSGRRVLLLGAGKIAERVAKELHASTPELWIANRTLERAEGLANRFRGFALSLDNFEAALERVDVVFAAIGADEPLLSGERLRRVMAVREGRPLLVVDLGVPSNVEPGHGVAGVETLDMDAITAQCAMNAERRSAAIPLALDILDDEIERFRSALVGRAASPTIRALMQRGEAVRQRNLDWAMERLEGLGPKERRVVEDLTRRLMMGLLNAPLEELKAGGVSACERAAVERVFRLGECRGADHE